MKILNKLSLIITIIKLKELLNNNRKNLKSLIKLKIK
jgi:hypothetical protein